MGCSQAAWGAHQAEQGHPCPCLVSEVLQVAFVSASEHDVDDDSLSETDLYESPNPMVLIRKKINKENK